MKVCWFHLMPYPELPEDFREQVTSVWVDIPSRMFDPVVGGAAYREYISQLEHADAAGFDGICVNEHHQNGYGLMASPNLIAATLARSTSRAALIVLGNSIALYSPPVRVAEEMAMLDCISGGRLVAGFPVGTQMDTAYCYGMNPATLRDRYLEAHELITRAWTEPDIFTFNGRYTQLRYVNPWPRPIQQPRPPIWIPGNGTVETFQWTAEMDYVYCYLSYFGYKAGGPTMEAFWREIDRFGYEPNPYRAGFLQFVGVGDTDQEAYDLYREPAEYFHNRCLLLDPRFMQAPGYTTESAVRSRASSMVTQAARRSPNMPTWDEMVEAGWVVIGSPETVRDKLEEIARTLRVGHLMILQHFGNMSPELTTYNTDLFAAKVLPDLQHVWEEYEDRWWPTACA